MTTEQTSAASAPQAEASDKILQRFFETSEAARRASAPLKKAAEVAVRFTDVPGDFHFTVADGTPKFVTGKAKDPDFDLVMAPGAVAAIAAQPNADAGDLGILFFEHILSKEPQQKIDVKLHSGVMKLTMRGYLGVVAQGGGKVMGWMARKGLKGPSAIASAISRLKKG